MDKILTLRYNIIAKTEELAKKNNSEAVHDFRKKGIELPFVDVDEQLAQLAENYDNISRVRRLITIQQIRNRLFELCNLCVYGMNVREFASHEPGDRTPQRR